MKRDTVIYTKSYAFAIRIVNAYKYLTETQKEFILAKQLLRSGTSVGALCREAEHAQSKADFVNKMNIALKEANETDYWLSLLKDCNFIDQITYESIYNDCSEIIKILVSIIKTAKRNTN